MPKLTDAARDLRGRSTEAEARLWYHLRAHRLDRLKFKRQQPIGQFIVDFACFDCNLIVEADGSQHLDCESDRQRDAWLSSQGFRVLRFWNDDILTRTERVLESILYASRAHSSPTRLLQGERGDSQEES